MIWCWPKKQNFHVDHFKLTEPQLFVCGIGKTKLLSQERVSVISYCWLTTATNYQRDTRHPLTVL